MASYPAVDLSGSTEDGGNPHDARELSGEVEPSVLITLGSYPYEATLRVYVVLGDGTTETVYTSTGGLERNYVGSVTVLSPTSVKLIVRRLQGWPSGSLQVRVERA